MHVAQIMRTGTMSSAKAAGGAAFSVTFEDSEQADAGGAASITTAALGIGAADADRWVFVVVNLRGSGAPLDVKYGGSGGTSMTEIAGFGGNQHTAIYKANITTGTSTQIFVDFDGTNGDYSVITLRSVSSTGITEGTEATDLSSGSSPSLDVSVNTSADDTVLYGFSGDGSGRPSPSNMTLVFDSDAGTNEWQQAGVVNGVAAATPRSITDTSIGGFWVAIAIPVRPT